MVNKKLADLAFKGRGLFWGVLALIAVIFPGSRDLARLSAGLLLVIAGQALRYRAAGYIPKYRTEVIGAPVLVTWGPYAYIRNPLYTGNAIMGLGWALMLSLFWVPVFALLFVVLYCMIIIPAEEEFLGQKFGNSYSDYRANVPALIPRTFKAYSAASAEEKPFSSKVAKEMEIHSIRMNLIITAAIILRVWFSR
jgi:protein-S-isoprenylcysteine O-methyltransferase Ste14